MIPNIVSKDAPKEYVNQTTVTTLLTTLSRLITENTEIIEIKMHENRPYRPHIRSNQSGTWSGNNHILNLSGLKFLDFRPLFLSEYQESSVTYQEVLFSFPGLNHADKTIHKKQMILYNKGSERIISMNCRPRRFFECLP